jgi:hypothetical protein
MTTTETITTETPTRGMLCATTMDILRQEFAGRDHRPSADHMAALEDIAVTLEKMADGTCAPHVYLSSVDCGVGKSSTVGAFARALCASAHHRGVGMLVCVGRIAEAQAMADAMTDCAGSVAVLTAETADDLTPEVINQTQVLITTQQRVARATEDRSFSGITTFHYQGAPRRVRAWDEEFIPGLAISLTDDALGPLLEPARRLCPAFRHALLALMNSLGEASTGQLLDIPDWQHLYGVTPYEMLTTMASMLRPARRKAGGDNGGGETITDSLRDDIQMTVRSLFFLGGKAARVWCDNRTGAAALHYHDTLPEDLKPLLVLDASGRVRQTYTDQVRYRGLVRLREARKDYSPLTVHWWKRGGGKASFKTGGAEIAKGVAATIASRPSERWLCVIHRKDRTVGDVRANILKELPRDARDKVAFITWGQHMGINDYADVPNLILVGSLFMSPGHYVALTQLTQDRPIEQGFAAKDDIRNTEQGETANLVFQAICRGRVRKSDGARCRPMQAYVIASERSGLGTMLPTIFPGCSVAPWSPLQCQPKGSVRSALAYVDHALAGGSAWVPFSDVREAVGIRDKRNFRKRVLNHPAWSDGLASRCLVVSTGPRRESGVSRSEPLRIAA